MLALSAALLLVASSAAYIESDDSGLARVKRQAEPEPEGEHSAPGGNSSAEGNTKSKGGGVSLGKILGLLFLACCIIYCVGIGYKVYKVCKGTYVEEEPVFLKYK